MAPPASRTQKLVGPIAPLWASHKYCAETSAAKKKGVAPGCVSWRTMVTWALKLLLSIAVTSTESPLAIFSSIGAVSTGTEPASPSI